MGKILVERDPSPMKLDVLGVDEWDIWQQDVSECSRHYDRTETCYVLQGDAVVTPDDGMPVTVTAGDLVTFLPDLSCTWEIRSAIRIRYRTG